MVFNTYILQKEIYSFLIKKILFTIILIFILILFGQTSFANNQSILTQIKVALENKNYKKVLLLAQPLAKQGDPEAQLVLGKLYYFGDGVKKDLKVALEFILSSAEQKNSDAQNFMGFIYHEGLAVVQNYKIAAHWYLLSAEQGQARAQGNLGYLYKNGLGVKKNIILAHMWMNLASRDPYISGRINVSAFLRDELAKEMSPEQINLAQEYAEDCLKKDFKNCNYE